MKAYPIIAIVLLILAGCSGPQAEAPSVEDQLVEEHITAQGGLERIRSINSVTMEGEVELPTMGMKLPLIMQMKRPGLLFSEVDVEAAGIVVTTGFDGETAWTINPMMGSEPIKLGGAQVRMMKDQADMDGLLVGYKAKGQKLTYEGEADVRGKPASKLLLTRPDSSTAFVYLDSETALITRVDSEGINPTTGVPAPMQTYFLDYREVEGVKMPYRIEAELNGQVVQKVVIESIAPNRMINDSVFQFPGGN